MSHGDDARFTTFIQSTISYERDRIAFSAFESAIQDAVLCATMINMADGGPEAEREHAVLTLVIGEMLFRALRRIDVATVIVRSEGIGYGVRYGIIEARREALDDIMDAKAFEALAAKGYEADQADTDRRRAELDAQAGEDLEHGG